MNIRNHVQANPRSFCASGGPACGQPQYPKDDEAKVGCKGFRCSRCKSTVGWCRGSDHGFDHPGNGWCDDCFCEVYVEPVKLAQRALKGFFTTTADYDPEDPKPNVRITDKRPPRSIFPQWRVYASIVGAVRKAGVTCTIYINGELQE